MADDREHNHDHDHDHANQLHNHPPLQPDDESPPGRYEVRLEGARRDWPAGRAPDELSRTQLTVNPRP